MKCDQLSITERAISEARRQVLDLVEISCGNNQNWPAMRAQILKIFGRNGLLRIINGTDDKHGMVEYGSNFNRSNQKKC